MTWKKWCQSFFLETLNIEWGQIDPKGNRRVKSIHIVPLSAVLCHHLLYKNTLSCSLRSWICILQNWLIIPHFTLVSDCWPSAVLPHRRTSSRPILARGLKDSALKCLLIRVSVAPRHHLEMICFSHAAFVNYFNKSQDIWCSFCITENPLLFFEVCVALSLIFKQRILLLLSLHTQHRALALVPASWKPCCGWFPLSLQAVSWTDTSSATANRM